MPSKKELVNKLVEAGMPAVEADKFVTKCIETHTAKYGDELKALKYAELMVNKALINLKSRDYDVVEGICCGYSEIIDVNGGMIRKALDMYQQDKNKALLENYVTIDANGNPVPLDYRATIRGKPNPNYGKPLESRYIQDVTFLVDGKIMIARLEDPSVAFSTYSIYEFGAKRSQNGKFLYLVDSRPVQKIGVESPDTVYDMFMRAAVNDESFVEIAEIDEIEPFKYVISYGEVISKKSGDKYSLYWVDNIENPRGEPIVVRTICNNEAEEGNPVAFMGKLFKNERGITVRASAFVHLPVIDEGFIDMTEVF